MNMKTVLMLAAAAVLFSAPAHAAAGGGGGGGLPSSSGPSVDPAEAFRDGVAALEAREYNKAEKNFRKVLSIAPKHPEANYYMALAKIGNGKPKDSIRYLEKAIKARENFVEARERLALVRIELGEADAAREQLAEIEGLKAACASAGDCAPDYVARVETAIAQINAALAPPPSDLAGPDADGMDAGDGIAEDESASDSGEETDGEQMQSLFFAPREDGVADYLAAVKLINEADYEAAIKGLYQAAAIVGPHPDILNYLGYSHRKLGKMAEAQDYYAQALAIDPDHKGANEYLGELYLEIGETEKAKRQLARLDRICAFGCAEREDLARLIALKATDRRAER